MITICKKKSFHFYDDSFKINENELLSVKLLCLHNKTIRTHISLLTLLITFKFPLIITMPN